MSRLEEWSAFHSILIEALSWSAGEVGSVRATKSRAVGTARLAKGFPGFHRSLGEW